MSRYTDGMKAGARAFEEMSRQSAQTIREATSAMRKDVGALRSSIYNIIDLIGEDDPEKRADILAALQENREKNKKPAAYQIQIIYAKEYKQMANDLRETLNRQGNAASIQTYADYKTHNVLADYYILLGYYDNKKEEVQPLLDVAGCHIDRFNKHIYVYREQIGDSIDGLTDEEWQKFIDYYSGVTQRAISETKTLQKANKYRRKKQARKGTPVSDAVMNGGTSVVELITDKLGIFGLVLDVPILLGAFVTTIVVGLPELLVRETMNALENRDNAGVNEAQKQILLVKTGAYINECQILHAQ